MTDKVFFDTNILVYANDSAEPRKQEIARNLIKNTLTDHRAVISVQVLSEFWVTVTQKIKNPLPESVAEKELELFELMDIIDIRLSVFQDALKMKKLFSLSFWDSLILSAADSANCKIVYSEDMQNGQIISNMRIVNPFTQPNPSTAGLPGRG
jgi:predicted nucleic acid-binding protein